ncbi:MAG: PQQ-like beta-propeller repeat protein [Planctomycetia bacterium]|nr:PQQ-like beta-propeller repeat protein [Planctomycetia bacterium]
MHRIISPLAGSVLLSTVVWIAGGLSAMAQSLLCGTAGDELVAARAGLTREWVVQIPFDSAGWRLEHVSIGDDLVVACSGDGGVHAVQASPARTGSPRAGSVLWSQRVGTPGGPVAAAGIGPKVVTVARDLDLYAFDSADGSRMWHRSFGRPPSASAVSSDEWVYAPLTANGVMRLPVNPTAQPRLQDTAKKDAAASQDRPAKQPSEKVAGTSTDPLLPISLDAGGRVESGPIAYKDGVVWCTESGLLVGIVPFSLGWKRLEFDLRSGLTGPPAIRDAALFVATEEGDLARIDDTGQEDAPDFAAVWHVVLVARPQGSPLVSGQTVVVSLGDAGIHAFSATTGDELWRSCVVGRLVATTGNRVWCVDEVGRLASLDLATGMPSEWMCLGSFTLPLTNTVTERLVLASPDGLIVSLAPRRTTSKLPPPPPKDEKQPPAAAEPVAEERTET